MSSDSDLIADQGDQGYYAVGHHPAEMEREASKAEGGRPRSRSKGKPKKKKSKSPRRKPKSKSPRRKHH